MKIQKKTSNLLVKFCTRVLLQLQCTRNHDVFMYNYLYYIKEMLQILRNNFNPATSMGIVYLLTF